MKTIVIANHKGGVAKTTTALNLAVILANQGSRVLACDLDPQGNLSLALGANLQELDPIEQAVYTQLFRLTHGFSKPTCIISLPRLAERANIGTTATHGAVKRLVSKGLVEKRTRIVGKGKEQGIEFSLPLPVRLTRDVRLTPNASLTFNEPIKENTIKDTHNTEAGVCVISFHAG